MQFDLPEVMDPWRFAQERQERAGAIDPMRLTRLQQTVESIIAFNFQLSGITLPDNHKLGITGQVTATLQLLCQRCLEPFEQQFRADFIWQPVATEEELNTTDTTAEKLLVAKHEFYVVEAMEDEILLLLPMIPLHNVPCNQILAESAVNQDQTESHRGETRKPFADLSSLLNI